ncbi:uncharacterized protein Z518_08723 [Rhinocladiella mackenziei CBS 650.93]|uniref:Uncharacterized protein n=1 Tax=Rhinocladiella mackenziei CBS 650.93 TaxID=1442369 RepID=A0A0D2IHK1_9EURO|nr:uncharacterized protein Z518_08723 [Rhinocladiella mackenziei CBS 650.93]KIX02781.1 hypothetical protein Z518_08723 [Rhinocladiella mackenziei CBS 650.93]
MRRRIAQPLRAHFNASQVLSMLNKSDCLIPSEKLAIPANGCGWKRRLDTQKANSEGWSFSARAWVLPIANADASSFCQFDRCNDTGQVHWPPRTNTRLKDILCPDLIDQVPMTIQSDGLQTEGWLWKAVRGRRLIPQWHWPKTQIVPFESFDEVLDPVSGDALPFYKSLGFDDPEALSADTNHWLHNHYAFGDERVWTNPVHLNLLGNEAQLRGLSWTRDVVIQDGGLTIGQLVSNDDTESLKKPAFALMNSRLQDHIATQYRPVWEYDQQEWKARALYHPLDVWLQDKPSHLDIPFSWTATVDNQAKNKHGIRVDKACNMFFDIGEFANDKRELTLLWPEECGNGNWTN